MTNLENLKTLLDAEKVDYRISADEFTLASAKSGAQHYGISLSEAAPTFILKSGNSYFAAIISGNTRISFVKLKQVLNLQDITMADPDMVQKVTGARIGSVSLINPALTTLIDKSVLKNEYCYGGCGVPKMTLKIKTADLVRVTNAQVLDFTDLR